MDITLWENLSRFHFDLNHIKRAIKLEDFSTIFNGMSLFHYFSGRPEVISIVHKLFEKEKRYKIMNKSLKNLPLQILNPDFNNKTALELSIINQSPKSFEIMIDLLDGFSDICLTKMMLS